MNQEVIRNIEILIGEAGIIFNNCHEELKKASSNEEKSKALDTLAVIHNSIQNFVGDMKSVLRNYTEPQKLRPQTPKPRRVLN